MHGSKSSSLNNSDNSGPLNPDIDHLSSLIERLSKEISRLRDQQTLSRTEAEPAAPVDSDLPEPTGKTLREIVDELLAAKSTDGLSKRYIETMRGHLQRFADALDEPIQAITTKQIEEWLRARKITARTRNNERGSIVLLFHFAQKRGYLPKGKSTEADDIGVAKEFAGKIGILKPDDLRRLLEKPAPREIHLFLALGAFTGMRSSEILRLEWRDINFDRGFITVAPEKAKTATRRIVPILPNMMSWLVPYRGATGLIFRSRRDVDRAIAFAKGHGTSWPNNALRHSYASYRLPTVASADRVALEMGTSPRKLMQNYRELVGEEEGQAWFSIFAPAEWSDPISSPSAVL